MKKIALATFAAALAFVSPAVAQPGPPPSPWVYASPLIYAPAGSCVALPQTVAGGCVTGNSINIAGSYYLNGTALTAIETVSVPLALTANALSLNINSSLAVDGSNDLGFNLGNANAWTVAQTMPGVNAPASTSLSLNAPTGQSILFQINGVTQASINASQLQPTTDNALALGGASNRWTTVFGVNATISTKVTTPQVTAPAATNLLFNAPTGEAIQLGINGSAIASLQSTFFSPTSDNAVALGGSGNRWSTIYGVAETVSTITSPAATNLGLNAPTGQTITFSINNVQQVSVATNGVLNVGAAGTQQGQLVIASPTANAMTLTPAASATGTATIPSGTYNFVGDTLTQTLTNKTLASSTDVVGGVTMTLGSDAEGDMYYRHSGVLTRLAIGSSGQALEVSGGIPSWQTLAGTGTVTSAGIAASGGATTSGTCTITSSGTCTVAAPGGFLNVLRNSSLTSWFHGIGPLTITTAGGWCAEGVWVIPTGASVTCQQIQNYVFGGPVFAMKITGNTSVTDVIVRFVIESVEMGRFGSAVNTFQMNILNSTGGTFTSTIQSKYANGGIDNWSGAVIDLAATNLQSCTNTSACTLAYSLTVAGATFNGYEYNIDLGNNFSTSGKSVSIGWFDARVTPGVATGLNSNPPPFEMRDPSADIAWNERFYQTSYSNGVAPGTASGTGYMASEGPYANGGTAANGVQFRTRMRTAPASISYYDHAGTATKCSYYNASTWTDGNACALNFAEFGDTGFVYNGATGGNPEVFHWVADLTIPGG